MLLAALGGCTTIERGPDPGSCGCASGVPRAVPNVQGPWGAPVPQTAAYSMAPSQASMMMASNNGANPNVVQAGYSSNAGVPAGAMQTSGICGPNGCPKGAYGPGAGGQPPVVPVMPPIPGMFISKSTRS